MKGWLQRAAYKMNVFMAGRYGFDRLSQFLIIFAVFFSLFTRRLNSWSCQVIYFVLLGFAIYRTLSKNPYKRRKELNKYYELTAGFRKLTGNLGQRLRDRNHKYIKCKNCSTIMRVPKGKGTIVVTCPKCHNKIKTKS